ncbi:MAG: hypothetical protein Q7S37_00410 [bacterium]|nr:hypothetical protein [bacterium]
MKIIDQNQCQGLLTKILWIAAWILATIFITSNFYFPLPVYIGVDWESHFSLTNYSINFFVWAIILYLLYKYLHPLLKINRLFFLLILCSLIITSLTVIIKNPSKSTSIIKNPTVPKIASGEIESTSGEIIWLKHKEFSSRPAQTRTDSYRGLPAPFYHHWTGYDTMGQVSWDYITLTSDTLIFNAIFWFIVSSFVVRFKIKSNQK